jgi:hypothetical protein
MWLPDMDSPAFIRRARRDALAVARSVEEKKLQDWVDSLNTNTPRVRIPVFPNEINGLRSPSWAATDKIVTLPKSNWEYRSVELTTIRSSRSATL